MLNHKNINILILNEKIPWMGKHSGYDKLFILINESKLLRSKILNLNRDTPGNIFLRKFLRPLIKIGKNYSHMYDYPLLKAEFKLIYYIKLLNFQLLHITFLERNYGILQKFTPNNKFKLICTAHQPPSWWKQIGRNPEIVKTLDHLITMSRKQLEFFEQFIPGRVTFISHAVDTEFFKPVYGLRDLSSPSCVFCGTWLRDFKSLEKIIGKVLSKNKSIRFDLIIPNLKKNKENEYIQRIARNNEVNFHSDLSNNELLNIYQQASMLILPIFDATANNALLEAISCGLPVISNKVGGIVDYTESTFADLHEVGDVDSFVESIFTIIDDKRKREERSISARNYTTDNLSLEIIFNKTLAIYNNLI